MGIVLTHSAKYKPMSFERLIQPYVMATEEYRTLEKGIADLDAEAATIKQLAMSEPEGSETRTRYEQYAAELESKASDLASKGLKGVNRKSLYDLQAQYNNKIKPIDTAAKMRAAEIAEQKEGMKDPTMRYSRNAATTSLDYYLNNTSPTYDRLSGATLAAQTKDMVSGIAKQMREDPRKWESILGGQYYQTKMQQGYTDEEILLAAANDPNAPRELTNIVRNVIDSSRLLDWEGARDSEGNLTDYGEELEDWAWKEASKGLWVAASTATYNIQSNRGYPFNTSGNIINEYSPTELRGNPYNIYVKNLSYEDYTNKKNEIDKYSHYFDENGKLTKEGKTDYYAVAEVSNYNPQLGTFAGSRLSPSNFNKFIANITGVTDRNLTDSEIEKAYSDYVKSLTAEGGINADTIKYTAFDVQFEDPNIILKQLTSGMNNGIVPVQVFDTKQGYIDSSTINLNDTEFKNATIAGEYGLNGNFIVITTNKNKQYRIPLSTINKALDSVITEHLKGAYALMHNPKGIPYTEEELNAIQRDPFSGKLVTKKDKINSHINNALYNFGSIAEEVQTEPLKVKGGLHP